MPVDDDPLRFFRAIALALPLSLLLWFAIILTLSELLSATP